MAKRLFVDMDGTLAKFHDVTNYLERMYEEDFFYNLDPFENMVAGINLFIEQYPDTEVYIISSCIESPFCTRDKNKWLDVHLDIAKNHRIFPPVGRPKSAYIPGGVGNEDFLLDDYNRGLNQFMYDGGHAIKCHNNINQQGIGAYGGSSGNLWVGPMVHTEDSPEIIAAELAQSMGLEVNLSEVLSENPEINLDLCEDGQNPLNYIRLQNGNEDFCEFALESPYGKTFYVPAHKLRAICMNLYNDPNYFKWLFNSGRESFIDFRKDVFEALERSAHPIVGRIDYLNAAGLTAYSQNFYSKDALDREIGECRVQGIPISESWYVTVHSGPLSEIKDYETLFSRLHNEYNLGEDLSADLAKSLITSAENRTPSQTQALINFWHTYRLEESLPEFLGIDDLSQIMITVTAKEDVKSQVSEDLSSGNQSLDSIISNAEQRSMSSNKGDIAHQHEK